MGEKTFFEQLRSIDLMIGEADRACRVLRKAHELKEAIVIQPDQDDSDPGDREDNEP